MKRASTYLIVSVVIAAGVLATGAQSQYPDTPGLAPVVDGYLEQPQVDPEVGDVIGKAIASSSRSATLFGAKAGGNGQAVLLGTEQKALRTLEQQLLRRDLSSTSAGPSISESQITEISISVESVQFSNLQLDNVMNDVIDRPIIEGSRIFSAGIDFGRNRVLVQVDKIDDNLRKALYKSYGDAIMVSPGVEIESQAMFGDTSPYYGGTEVGFKTSRFQQTPSIRCTTGFAWEAPNGLDTLITAGHCIQIGTNLRYIYTNRNNWSRFMGDNGTSNVDSSGSVYWNGGYQGDLALINVRSPQSTTGTIDIDNRSSRRVVGVRYERYGMPYCTTGISQYGFRNCTYQVDSPVATYRASNSGRVYRGVIAGSGFDHCTKPGDSGGPAYQLTNEGVYAVGIHSGGGGGGSDKFGGSGDKCISYDTSIHAATRTFGGYLK